MNKGYEKTVPERMNDFLLYHREGDGECNGELLQEYCRMHNFTEPERLMLAYFYSVTYCCASAAFLFWHVDDIRKDPEGFAKANKNRIIFQSDRKYIKMRDCFEQTLIFFRDNEKMICSRTLLSCAESNFNLCIGKVSGWPQFGRFSAFLMLETVCMVLGASLDSGTIVWKDGNTATSGLLNLYGADKAADAFDKGRYKPIQRELDALFKDLVSRIRNYGGEPNTAKVETSLCAYRKFYKGSRYNGYYLDRILAELNELKRELPEICDEMFSARARIFDADMLGEISGWEGIRPLEKKRYLSEGTMFGLTTTR